MVIKEEEDGFVILRGRESENWIIAPFWPCSGNSLRKVARSKASKDWVDEACRFADAEFYNPDGDVPSEEQESSELED